jgi:flagellar biosynthesis protein FlhF
MRLRRFEAATVSEALAKVRADLGPDAVILHARETERDRPSPSQNGWVEVTAAIDDEVGAAHRTIRRAGWRGGEELPGETRADAPAPKPGPQPVALLDRQASESDRIEEMYRMLLELREGTSATPRMPAALRPLYQELCRRELPAALARRLLLDLSADAGGSREGASRVVLQTALGRAFRVRRMADQARGQRVVALVGPTGVGKTTTLAKLAGQCRQAGRLKVALMSLDTYRIGAMAQMQIYAELLQAPLHVVRTPGELDAGLQAERDADLVLLDSMGRSPQHREGIADLQPFLQRIPSAEVHLVVSATTKSSDAEEILQRFRPLAYQYIVISKLDEARSLGPLLGLALQQDLSISYLTTGQEVPDDLEPATSRRLATLLVPSIPDRRSRRPARA